MLDIVRDLKLDTDLDALFSRVSNFVIRCKSDIEPAKPFERGTGSFVYKRGFDLDKSFTVAARRDFEDSNKIHAVVSAQGQQIALDFDISPDAFVKQGQSVSAESVRKLHNFMIALR